jgi:predicted nucleotidyltransferase
VTNWTSLRGNAKTALQFTLLQSVVHTLELTEECLGAAIAGSFAKGTADRVSDLDILIYVGEGSERSVLDKLVALAHAKEVFFEYTGTHDEHSVFRKFIFLDFTSAEFHVVGPQTDFGLRLPYLELVNRNDYLRSRLSHLPAPTHADGKAYTHGDTGLSWELFNCIKWLHRGEFETAKSFLLSLGNEIGNASNSAG